MFGSEKDPYKNTQLVKMLLQHKIDVYKLNQSLSANGKDFASESSFIVPLDQSQYRLIKGIFETRTSFNDSLFYDVSTWTMPLAYNLNYAELGKNL